MLTAAHIANSEINTVTFDNSTFYSRDLTYIPQTIGFADLKVFKLTAVPTVGAANLYTGTSELSYGASLVGWGRGRVEGSTLNTNTVPIAAGGTSLVKRWGTNDPSRTISSFNSSPYTFNALESVLGNVAGDPGDDGNGNFEAAATPRDSGSGLFQQISGTWYLTGLTSAILQQSSGNVTFGNDVPWSGTTPAGFSAPGGTGDPNIFVRVTSYANDINALLPVPEPSSSLLFFCASLLGVMRRNRPRGM
jgi:PEP-CTERM motif